MSRQALRVLTALYLAGQGGDTDTGLSLALGIPPASVRRSIQECIAAGHNVTYAGHTGLYIYSTPQQTGV